MIRVINIIKTMKIAYVCFLLNFQNLLIGLMMCLEKNAAMVANAIAKKVKMLEKKEVARYPPVPGSIYPDDKGMTKIKAK